MNKDLFGLTSSHHMALEAAIRRIKVILQEKREQRKAQEEMGGESNNLIGMNQAAFSHKLPLKLESSGHGTPTGNRLLSGFGNAIKKSLQIKSGTISLNQGHDRLTNLLMTEQERRGGGSHTGTLLTPADIISMASKRLEIFKHKQGQSMQQV